MSDKLAQKRKPKSEEEEEEESEEETRPKYVGEEMKRLRPNGRRHRALNILTATLHVYFSLNTENSHQKAVSAY